MKLKKVFGTILMAGVLVTSHVAQAHISYSGRDFGSYSGLTNGSKTITNQTVTGNYGWADAADGVLGDSHRGRAFRFHLDNSALVSLSVSANASATTNSLGGFTPAYSIYSGLAAIAPYAVGWTNLPVSADHDFGPASVAWRIWWVQQNIDTNATTEAPTDGSWNAIGDWKIGGDGDLPGDFAQLSSFTYKASAASTTSGGTVNGSFALPAGDYTVFIGGNDIANKTSGTALSPYGISTTFSVSPTPATVLNGKAVINYNQSAWESLASGIATPPVLTLSAFFNQAQANALTQSELLSTNQTGYSYSNQIYALNGATVTNLSTRYTQPTTFQYQRGYLTNHTGTIGLGGVARFAVLGGFAGNLLFGDYTLQYDSARIAFGGSGWYLLGNIPPAAAVFDLINVSVVETTNYFTISGDLGVSFEVANFLFATPADTLANVGTFNFTGYTVPFTTPGISSLAVNGGNVTLRGANGLAGSGYSVLSTTNLALPFAAWDVSAVGTFSGDGKTTNSIPVSAGEPARFFRLQQP